MEPWVRADFERFKVQVCDEDICNDCNTCDRSDEDILGCFEDLTGELAAAGEEE
jgi:hypothetical protein